MFKTTASSEFPESLHSGTSAGHDEVGTSNATSRSLLEKPSKSFRMLKDAPNLRARGGFTLLTILLSPFGTVGPPPGITGSVEAGGLANFISNILKLLIVLAGVYAVFNFVLAGYAFMSAGDDPKKMAGAWAKIYQTLLGLVFAAGAFVIASLAGSLIFKDPNALLQLKIFGP